MMAHYDTDLNNDLDLPSRFDIQQTPALEEGIKGLYLDLTSVHLVISPGRLMHHLSWFLIMARHILICLEHQKAQTRKSDCFTDENLSFQACETLSRSKDHI